MMTERENFFAMLRGEPKDFTPSCLEFQNLCVGVTTFVDGNYRPGLDGFGVNWVATPEGCMPEPNNFRFTADDISRWRDFVTFPDVNAIPVEQIYEQEKAYIDRENKIISLNICAGPFERLVSFMGFTEALIALAEDPDSCKDFSDAFTDYRIQLLERTIDIYKPDMVTESDDIATKRSLFMAPDTWRYVFKPERQRLAEYLNERGIISGYHVCGYVEEIIPDFVEIGIQYWHSAQIMNDLPGIMTKYPKLIVDGGWDSSGPPSYVHATTEEVLAEGERCMREYGKFNNFILFPVLVNEKGLSFFTGDERQDALLEYWAKNGKRETV